MITNATSLKARVRNLAKEKNTNAQVLLQNYMFERFLERLSLSEFKEKFVLKGGTLITAIVGMDSRSTMDLDATIRSLSLTEENLQKIISAICAVQIQDGVNLSPGLISPIRHEDEYGGFRVNIVAIYGTIETPFNIDISTGDVITPSAIKYTFNGMFDKEVQFELWAYNIETVLAEKIETVLRRKTLNTRTRDFYDIYILSTTQKYDESLLKEAISATSAHRNTTGDISDTESILKMIAESPLLRRLWEKYRSDFFYAADITYEQVMCALEKVCKVLIE